MSSKLKIKPKKRKLPLTQNNQAAQAFGKYQRNVAIGSRKNLVMTGRSNTTVHRIWG